MISWYLDLCSLNNGRQRISIVMNYWRTSIFIIYALSKIIFDILDTNFDTEHIADNRIIQSRVYIAYS